MNNKIKNVFAFTLGAAAGSIITYKIIHARANAMIDDVKSVYASRHVENVDEKQDDSIKEVSEKKQDEAETMREYAAILAKNHYTNYSTSGETVELNDKSEKKPADGPRIISPDEYGEEIEYDTYTLIYYADGVLTDEDNVVIENIEDKIGADSLNHFGEYEDNCVCVRNDREKADYEILADKREYKSLNRSRYPNRTEG